MSDSLTATIDLTPIQRLTAVMDEYVDLTGKDQSKALRKAAREVDFALFTEFRQNPPRPTKGSITSAADSRGWTMNRASASFKTGMASALKILNGNKSGFFNISESGGVITASPVMMGVSGRILSRKSKRGGALVTQGASAPAGAVRLNVQALAVIRALSLREKAGAGGYMSTQFLTFKKITQGTPVIAAGFVAKNKATTGTVVGNDQRVIISGNVEHADSIAARGDIMNKAISRGADTYRADMYDYVVKRSRETIAKLSRS
jgi:hypothetical protein